MREADFDAVDEAISDGFEEDEGLVVFWVEDDLLKLALRLYISCCPQALWVETGKVPGQP